MIQSNFYIMYCIYFVLCFTYYLLLIKFIGFFCIEMNLEIHINIAYYYRIEKNLDKHNIKFIKK